MKKSNLIVVAFGIFFLFLIQTAGSLREYSNARESVYPSKIGTDGTDMSGDNRIDHIFFSRSLMARNPSNVLPPQSATYHPVHWAEIVWG